MDFVYTLFTEPYCTWYTHKYTYSLFTVYSPIYKHFMYTNRPSGVPCKSFADLYMTRYTVHIFL